MIDKQKWVFVKKKEKKKEKHILNNHYLNKAILRQTVMTYFYYYNHSVDIKKVFRSKYKGKMKATIYIHFILVCVILM